MSFPMQEDNPDIRYLGDDFIQGPSTPCSSAPTQLLPVIWKSHQFEQPLRPSIVKRLFKDKVIFRSLSLSLSLSLSHFPYLLSLSLCTSLLSFSPTWWRYHVSDHEYSELLLNIIKLKNPYCVMWPSHLCKYVCSQWMITRKNWPCW